MAVGEKKCLGVTRVAEVVIAVDDYPFCLYFLSGTMARPSRFLFTTFGNIAIRLLNDPIAPTSGWNDNHPTFGHKATI